MRNTLLLTMAAVLLGASPGVLAGDWSPWTPTSNNQDIQYRWWASTPSGSEQCHLQVRDLKKKATKSTSLILLVDYKYSETESTDISVAIFKETGENSIRRCISIGDVSVKEVKRED